MSHDPMSRLLDASECKNQLELAKFLDLHPSAVAAGKKRGKLPPAWLLTALRKKGVNPDWIATGSGPRFLVPSPNEALDSAWHYSVQIVLTNPSKVLGMMNMRELLAEAYRRCINGQDKTPD